MFCTATLFAMAKLGTQMSLSVVSVEVNQIFDLQIDHCVYIIFISLDEEGLRNFIVEWSSIFQSDTWPVVLPLLVFVKFI